LSTVDYDPSSRIPGKQEKKEEGGHGITIFGGRLGGRR
jgi:hypothetical protein